MSIVQAATTYTQVVHCHMFERERDRRAKRTVLRMREGRGFSKKIPNKINVNYPVCVGVAPNEPRPFTAQVIKKDGGLQRRRGLSPRP